MTVRENVQMARMSHLRALTSLRHALGRRADRAEITHAYRPHRGTGAGRQANRPASELAYGDLKRLELAMAFANDPRLLLMDEPTAGMAPGEREALMKHAPPPAASATWRCCSPSTIWMWCSVLLTA